MLQLLLIACAQITQHIVEMIAEWHKASKDSKKPKKEKGDRNTKQREIRQQLLTLLLIQDLLFWKVGDIFCGQKMRLS